MRYRNLKKLFSDDQTDLRKYRYTENLIWDELTNEQNIDICYVDYALAKLNIRNFWFKSVSNQNDSKILVDALFISFQ